MTTIRQHHLIASLAGFVFLLIWMWCLGVKPAASYAPIDQLVTSIEQLVEAGKISDKGAGQYLATNLRTIGSLIDQGERDSAVQLLNGLHQVVTGQSGLMTPEAASRIADEMKKIAAAL